MKRRSFLGALAALAAAREAPAQVVAVQGTVTLGHPLPGGITYVAATPGACLDFSRMGFDRHGAGSSYVDGPA